MKKVWKCSMGHTNEVEDTGDAASRIAIESMRAFLKKGCDNFDRSGGDKNPPRCPGVVTEQ